MPFTVTYWNGSTLYQVNILFYLNGSMSSRLLHCYSQRWLCVISKIPLSLPGMVLHFFQISAFCLVVWLFIILGIPPPLYFELALYNIWCVIAVTGVAVYLFSYTIVSHWANFLPSQVFRCCSHWWFHVRPSVPL